MSPVLATYGALAAAITLEVSGTALLQKSAQMTRLAPTVAMVGCYVGSFYCLSHALKTIPVGVAYAIWSGLGIVLISAVGHIFLKQKIDAPAAVGMALIIAGVVTVNLFSRSSAH